MSICACIDSSGKNIDQKDYYDFMILQRTEQNFFPTNAKIFRKFVLEGKRGWDLIGKIYGSPDLVARHFFSIQKGKKEYYFHQDKFFLRAGFEPST